MLLPSDSPNIPESSVDSCNNVRNANDSFDRTIYVERFFLYAIFVSLGVSVGVVGPTILQFEKITNSREDEISLIFTYRALGSIGGFSIGRLLLDLNVFQAARLLSVGMLGLSVVTLLITWLLNIWGVMVAFIAQGVFTAISVEGSIGFSRNCFRIPVNARLHRFTIAFFLGCALAPSFYLPFTDFKSDKGTSASLSNYSRSTIVLLLNKRILLYPTVNVSEILQYEVDNKKTVPTGLVHRTPRNASMFVSPNYFENNTKHEKINTTTDFLSSDLSMNFSMALNINISQTTLPMQVVTNTPANTASTFLPKKPLINDAKHLNQDSSSADGSQAASKMKQIVEDRRIGNALNNPAAHPYPSKDNLSPLSDAHQINSDNRTQVSMATSKSPLVTPRLLDVTVNSDIIFHNGSSLNISSKKLNVSFSVISTEIANITTMMPVTTNVEYPSQFVRTTDVTPTLVNKTKFTVMANQSGSRSTNISTYPIFSSYHRERVVKHSSYNVSRILSFSFEDDLSPARKVHLIIASSLFILWLFTIPFTNWFVSICSCNSSTLIKSNIELSEFSGCTVEQNQLEQASREQYCPEDEDTNSEEDSDSNMANIALIQTHQIKQAEPGASQTQIQRNCNSTSCTSLKQWPTIHWSSNIWLILAVFMNSGLETSYGGFVYGFALRHLYWSQRLGLLITGLFWLGNLAGSLVHHFLRNDDPEHRFSDRRNLLQRRTKQFFILFYKFTLLEDQASILVQLCGSLICILSAVAMTTLSFSAGNCRNQHSIATLFSNQFVWLSGSLLLGLGTGMSPNSIYFNQLGINQEIESLHYKLQLSCLCGQLVVPAFVGYLNHQAWFWPNSCILGPITVSLSVCLNLALLVHFITTLKVKRSSPTLPASVLRKHSKNPLR